MARSEQNERRERLMNLFDTLSSRYGALNWWPADTPFEVCVGAILTQNTNWLNVEKAIANLRGAGLLSAQAIHDTGHERLAELIRPSGFFNIKSARLKGFTSWLIERFGSLDGMFQRDWQLLRPELMAVPGIGPETCDSILLYAGNKPSFVVDAYTRRLFSRLGLVSEKDDYHRVRALFMELLPPDVQLFNDYHALIVEQCKRHCRKRAACDGCPLSPCCAHRSADLG